jgi:hypothetical protein
MKAIVRNVLLACLISTFALFGALGRRPVKQYAGSVTVVKQTEAAKAESTKETLTCLSVAFLAWALCFWRCSVLNRRLDAEREYQRRFSEYMRSNLYNNRSYGCNSNCR